MFEPSQATPLAIDYRIDTLGFTDSEHTDTVHGSRYSTIAFMNPAGQVAGISTRYAANSIYMGESAWLYSNGNIINIGLTDNEYTNSITGMRRIWINSMNATGQVAGRVTRFGPNGTALGQSAWLYSNGTTLNIGLTDTEHTRDTDGYRVSNTSFMNEAGQVSGTARRYGAGATNLGQSVWLHSDGNTTVIGLVDAQHTRETDGLRYADISAMNGLGQVAGTSSRFGTNGASLGQNAWRYSNGQTTAIGLVDAEHTRITDGYHLSDVFAMNAAGQVVGTSWRYGAGGAYLGYSAWVYNSGNTVDIGLTDSEHTGANDGHRESYIVKLNEAGHVAGYANRYGLNSGDDRGRTAWLYSEDSTQKIGLIDSEHTRITDGYRYATISDLNQAGQVAGTSIRYDESGALLGKSAWLYSDHTTVNIGLNDNEHTRDSDGYRSSDISDMNESGQVVGVANRYGAGGTSLGQSAWLYDNGGTVNIGLTDAVYTRDIDGYRSAYIFGINQAGQVAGMSGRFGAGSTYMGSSAWFFDMTVGQSIGLDLSVRSDGYAYSEVQYLSDDGLLLGSYSLFDTDDNMLGKRAFAFTLENGAVDLGGLVNGGLDNAGWNLLANAYLAGGLGQLAGEGLLSDMGNGSMAYLLTPQAVPVPPALWLFASGLLGLLGAARRKVA